MTDFSQIPPLNTADLLRRHGLRPDKRLGQNFLQDAAALERIACAAEIKADDSVLEVGPGLGSLTRYLATAAREVVAVELDERLIPPLEAVLAPWPNVRLIRADMLSLDPAGLIHTDGYVVAANIPYYITSALLRHLLETEPRPRRVVLTVQKEVAERVCAAPGDMSLLALSVQVYGEPSIAGHIPAGAFYPAPNVDSAILSIAILPTPRIDYAQLDSFFRLARAGFSQKRKTLRNALSGGLRLPPAEAASLLASASIDPQRRAETLSLDEWGSLVDAYAKDLPQSCHELYSP
jgi:16S rRNA (adenine1518-N6/adenine1519-N6)-dimethyltransferase